MGICGVVVLCGVTFYNDMVIRGSFLVGSFLPASVFGTLPLVLLVVNPILARWRRNAALTARELGVIVAMVLFACSIPGRSLMHYFTNVLMLPHHLARTKPAWQGGAARFSEESVTDWVRLATALGAADSGRGHTDTHGLAAEAGDVLDSVRGKLSDSDQAALAAAATGTKPDLELRRHVLAALNASLADPRLPGMACGSGLEAARHVTRFLDRASAKDADPDLLARVNRGLLEACLPGAVAARKPAVLEHVPTAMLADPSCSETALAGFVNGLAEGDTAISIRDVPWRAWTRTMLFWVPLIVTSVAMFIGLALVLHRQWAVHERLRYPTVEFARALFPGQDGTVSVVFRDRLFWIGAMAVFLLHMNNYAARWWPHIMIPIATQFDFRPLLDLVPVYRVSGVHTYGLFKPMVYFSVVGITYFLASDAAFSLGIAPYVYGIAMGIAATYGVNVRGPFMRPSACASNYAGAYCAMFLVLVYTGRHYYLNVLRRSLGIGTDDAVAPSAVWGARAAMAAGLLLTMQLTLVGLDVPMGVVFVVVMVVIHVVMSRLVAEVGLFKLMPFFFPCALVWGMVGAKAANPDQLLLMGLVTSVLLVYPREAAMPFIVCGLRVADRARVRLGRVAAAGYAVYIVGLLVAIPITLYIQYQYGALRAGDGWSYGQPPRLVFDATCAVRQQLAARGVLEQSLSAGALERLASIRPMQPCLIGFAITFVLVWVFTILRQRFAWWPLHPVMFLVLASWQSTYIAFSLLLGWLIKAVVTKYGGAAAYQRFRPFMIGVIAGDLVAQLVPLAIGTIYYMMSGIPPPGYGYG